MKKNIGAQLALYPSPVIVVGAMVDGKPNWTLVAHAGTVPIPAVDGKFSPHQQGDQGDRKGFCQCG